jgi:quercetin dioxygenase-like cupin family protein
MPDRPQVEPRLVEQAEPLWFLGTLVRILVDGDVTGGRFSLSHLTLPHGAAPPVHSHPQDETFYLVEGKLQVLIDDKAQHCETGAVAFVPGGSPHSFRVDSDTATMLVLSTPAGIEDYYTALGEPAEWPWLQPPADGPRVPPERIEEVERAHGIVRHGPPPAASP